MIKRKDTSEGREAEPQKAGRFCSLRGPKAGHPTNLGSALLSQPPLTVLSTALYVSALSTFPQSPAPYPGSSVLQIRSS